MVVAVVLVLCINDDVEYAALDGVVYRLHERRPIFRFSPSLSLSLIVSMKGGLK